MQRWTRPACGQLDALHQASLRNNRGIRGTLDIGGRSGAYPSTSRRSRTSSHLIHSACRKALSSFSLQRIRRPSIPASRAPSFRKFRSAAGDATIYALSTAPGRAAIAIIRCSGNLCLQIYQGLCPGGQPLRPRRAAVRTLYKPGPSHEVPEVLDSEALVLYFPGPGTTTGEDVLELHVHGGPAIVKAVLRAIPKSTQRDSISSPTIRYAEPGEFTRRAFYNNRLDLTQVEALGDTLAAETEQQRILAVRGMSSTLDKRYEGWRNQLLSARGELEALIDFSEDQHFDESAEDFVESISGQVQDLLLGIQRTTRNAAKGELLRHGIRIALLGAPNAGKSSLLNQIVGREAAIVSSEAGTTRDVIEINVDIQGYFCKFNDLAGVRVASEGETLINDIEKEGIARAKAQARQADIVVVVLPIQKTTNGALAYEISLSPEIMDFVKAEIQDRQRILFVLNKVDLADQDRQSLVDAATTALRSHLSTPAPIFPVSCIEAARPTDGEEGDAGGLQQFLQGLGDMLSCMTSAEHIEADGLSSGSFDESLGTTQRQQALLEQCASELEAFLVNVRGGEQTGCPMAGHQVDVVLAAEHLRCAADCLAKITGRGESGDVEQVLGVVFEKFCVGK